MIREIRIKTNIDKRAHDLLYEIQNTLKIPSVKKISSLKLYRLEGCDKKTAEKFAQVALQDLHDQCLIDSEFSHGSQVIEVGYKLGVMNPEVASLLKTAQNLGISSLAAVDTSWEYHFYGDISEEELKKIQDRLLVNKTVEQVIRVKPTTLQIKGATKSITTVPIRSLESEQLNDLSQQYQLFLRPIELQAIQKYYQQIGRDPYDAELETIAQTWSEHCSHKTFKAELIVDGIKKESLMSRLKNTALQYDRDVISAFVDNAGVYRFYDGYAVLAKVETHNSPSALEPYGGASTGSGGVFRDIMGTGQGAKTIASTDMFCFAPPNLSYEELPPGCLHPRYLLRKVVAGVRDYGNRMGIPTNNGSVHFHKDFRAKPSVIVGAYGIMPERYGKKGEPKAGDRIFVLGGRTGRDGIHGATFSSGEMTAQTETNCATAVQIGNPITEKCLADAIVACRDKNLIRAITDCGAGGFSSAIGEMGAETGVSVQLERAPLKYSGMAPWEIWVSESQERMVCAVDPVHAQEFMQLCKEHSVEVTDVGYFTDNKKLQVTYNGELLCDLQMFFLHEGNPHTQLHASRPNVKEKQVCTHHWDDWIVEYKRALSDWNICSKEPIVRQYDHGVQGTNVLSPFGGQTFSGPNDATVLTPILGKPYGLIIAHGMNPILNRIDPYKGALWAIAEALSNLVAVGANVSDAVLVDNFIWPYPDAESLWDLDRAIDACVDAMRALEIPFISGKDSLSSTYRYEDGSVLKIPPVLCISAMGKIPDIQKTITSDFKKAGSAIVFVGELDVVNDVPDIKINDLKNRFERIHTLIGNSAVRACHDVSEGGIGVALAEMCFGNSIGAQIDLTPLGDPYKTFFNETAGCFLLEIDIDAVSDLKLLPHIVLGTTQEKPEIALKDFCSVSILELKMAWQNPLDEVFHQ